MRVAVHRVVGEADLVQQPAHGVGALAGRAAASDVEGLGDDLLDAHAGVQRRVGVLEHELVVLAQPAQRTALERAEVGSVDEHASAGGRVERDAQAAQGGLAAAGLADQAEGLPVAPRCRGGARRRPALESKPSRPSGRRT